MEDTQIRLLTARDSLEALTALLHAELGEMGFRYRAVNQTVEVTRTRIADGECYVAVHDDEIVGTAVLLPPSWQPAYCEWYARPDVAVLSQFAVEPRLQRRGLGGKLIAHLEARAAELGAKELSIDTAEGATHLIGLYERRGYRHVGIAQWDHTNYGSVLLSKRLVPKGASMPEGAMTAQRKRVVGVRGEQIRREQEESQKRSKAFVRRFAGSRSRISWADIVQLFRDAFGRPRRF